MKKRGLLAISALAALLAFAFLFSGVVSASVTDSPRMLYDESGDLIGMQVDPAMARREMSPDMLQSYGEPMEPVQTGQENMKVFSIEDDPIPMEPPFAADVLVYTSGTADDTPRIAFNPTDGWLWTAFTHDNGADDDIYVFYSDDVGLTWNPALQTTGAYNERNPAIAIAGNTIVIFYEQDNVGDEQHTNFMRSQDGGQNWAGYYMEWDWTNDPAYDTILDFDNPDVSVARPQWFHWTMDAYNPDENTRTVAFMWTEDDGDSWARVYWTIAWHIGQDLIRPTIMENTADELVHNAFQHENTTVGGYDIEWLIVDHPLTSVSGWFTNNVDDDNTELGPDIFVRDDSVYLVWQNGTVDPDLTAFYSDDGGASTLYILFVTRQDGFGQMYPSVYIRDDFVPHISCVNDTSITYLNNTDVLNIAWSQTKADDFPGSTVANFRATDMIWALNNPRIVFADARLGAADIWYTDLGEPPEIPITITRSPLIAVGDILVDGAPCPDTCVYQWVLGSSHTLEAPALMADPVDPANVRYAFTSWSDGGLQTHSYTTPSAAETVTAYYDPQYNIVVDTLPTGLEVVIDTVPYPVAPQSFWWRLGEVHNLDVTSPQTIDGTSRHAWQSWSDGGGQSHPVTITMVDTYIATFGVEYMVNITTNPAGLDVEVDGVPGPSPPPFWWLDGSVHDLYAISPQTVTPDEQWAWTDWSDAGAQAHPITVTGPATFTANYISQYNISFTTSPAGLIIEVDGVPYDTSGPDPVYFFWDVGSVHVVHAPSPQTINPTSQYTWQFWNDMGAQTHDITITGPATYTANFGVEFRIDVLTNPPGLNVTVDGIEHTDPHFFWCAQGDSAMLGAPSPQDQTPTLRYRWDSWSDMGTQSHPIICNMANTYTANFWAQYLLNVSSDPQGLLVGVDGIQLPGPQLKWYDTGAVVTIDAPSPQISGDTQAVYSHWNDVQPQTHQVTVTGPATYIAYFDTQFLMTVTSTPVTGLDIEIMGVTQVTEYQFWCDDGDLVNIYAISPQVDPLGTSRYVWLSWSDGGGQSHTVTCDNPNTYTASFDLEYEVTITSSPADRQVIVDSVTRAAPYVAWWPLGEVHNLDVLSPQVEIPGSSQFVWTSWSDAGLQNHDITVTGADTIVASFTRQYKITITTIPDMLEILADGVAQTTPFEDWWDESSSHSIGVSDPQIVVPGERFMWASWSDAGAQNHNIFVATSQTYTATMSHEFQATVDSTPVPVTVTIDGLQYTTPWSDWWLDGSPHSISAIDIQDVGSGVRYVYASWSDSGARTHNVVADGIKTLTADYTTQYEVTIATNPTGLDIIVDLATYAAPQPFWWDDGSSHTIDVVTPQPAGTGEQYAWTSWSDSGVQSHQVTVTQSETITATFGLEYEVTITSTPAGRDITVDSTPYVTPQTFWVASGGSLDVQGTSPQPGATGTQYAFSQWSDGPSTFARTITVTAPATYTAVFTTEYEVTITTSPAGMEMTVDSNTLTAPQTFWWADGTSHDIDVVTPQAGTTADKRYAFASWSDAGGQSHSVTVDQSETITATFDLQYQVTVTTSPAGRVFREGTTDHTGPSTFWVTSGGSLIISGTSPQPAGATDTRYAFASWADGPATFSRTITVTAALTYTAQFTTQHYLTVVSDYGNPQGEGWYDEDASATFSVTSPFTSSGVEYAFTGWSGDSTESGKSATVLMSGPMTVEAEWEESGFLAKFWWIFPVIIIIIIVAILAVWMMKRKKPEEEELPPPEEMEIPPEENEV